MELVSIIVCDGANTTQDGRFNVLGGGVDRIFAPSFPIIGHLTLVMRMEIHPAEVGLHRIGVKLMDADGQTVIQPLDMGVDFPKGARFVNSILNIGNISFAKAGSYSFEILFDGAHKRSWPLEVTFAPQPSAPPPISSN